MRTPTVLTYYKALGKDLGGRHAMLEPIWAQWCEGRCWPTWRSASGHPPQGEGIELRR